MQNTKFTPGPWAYAPYTKRSFGIGQAGDCALYMVKCEYGDTTIDICRSDVRLMAAAPELLEALIKLSNAYAFIKPPGYPKSDAELLANAAIAKATGVKS